jgi:hypothetical protein
MRGIYRSTFDLQREVRRKNPFKNPGSGKKWS